MEKMKTTQDSSWSISLSHTKSKQKQQPNLLSIVKFNKRQLYFILIFMACAFSYKFSQGVGKERGQQDNVGLTIFVLVVFFYFIPISCQPNQPTKLKYSQ